MSTIVTRAGKGSPLTNTEVDSNFTNLNTDKVESITSADGSVVVSSSGTTRDLSVGVAGSTATLISQVRNETGATLTKGTVVYISGAAGNKAVVSKALATGDSTSAQTYGMVQADIPHNQNGYVVVVGAVSGLNTSAFADGTQLYLSGVSAGGYTNTKPYAPTHLVYVGIVTYSHNTQGTIQVKIQNGYELDEIHDVSARSPVDGQTLVYVSSTGLWTKTDQASMSVGSAATLATARNINGVSFNGSADITVADATKLPLTGGTLTGKLTLDGRNEVYGVPTNAGTIAGFMGGTSGGTTAARTQSLNTQTLLNVAAIGYTGSAWVGGAGLSFVATEDITAANRGTKAVLTAIAAGDSVATTMEFNGSALTINGSTAVTSSNYNTYAPTKTGTGASGTWGINITGNAATATSATDSTKLPLAGGTLTGNVTLNTSDGEILVTPTGWRATDRAAIKIRSKANTPAEIDLRHTVGGVESGWHISARDTSSESELHLYRFNMTSAGAVDAAGSFLQMFTFKANGGFNSAGAITQAGNQVLHAGNYNSYSPTLTGTGASGTWGINVTGYSKWVDRVPNYQWNNATLPTGYNSGIETSFVSAAEGWPQYGVVLSVMGRIPSDPGGNFQLYMGHGTNYGGTSLRVRSVNQSGNVWTSWKILLDETNYTSYAMPSGSSATNSVDVRAPIFYDSNDTTYYLDPNSSTSAILAGSVGVGTTSPVNTNWGNASNTKQITVYGSDYGVVNIRGDLNTSTWYSMGAGNNRFYAAYDNVANRHRLVFNGDNTGFNGVDTPSYNIHLSGTGYATSDWRAPIFYDSQDTSFAVDPNATSAIRSMTVGYNGSSYAYDTATVGKLYFGSSGSDATDYYHIATTMQSYGGNYSKLDFKWYTGQRFYAHSAYGGFRFHEITNNTQIFSINEGGAFALANQSMRSPIFYDSDNTAYYGNFASTDWGVYSAGGGLFRNIQISSSAFTDTIQNVTSGSPLWLQYGHSGNVGLVYGGGNVSIGNIASPSFPLHVSRNANQVAGFESPNPNTWVDIISSTRTWSLGSTAGATFSIYDRASNVTRAEVDTGSNFYAYGSSRAPIFYDSNNTAYYGDFASTSQFNEATFAGYIGVGGVAPATNMSGTSGVSIYHANYPSVGFATASGPNYLIYRLASGGPLTVWNSSTSETVYFYTDRTQFTGSARAPIFYDSNDTTFYVDPNNTSTSAVFAGNISMNGAIVRRSAGTGYLSGNYGGGGETTSTTGAIYTIGGSYYPTSSGLNNMYGVGYTYAGVAGGAAGYTGGSAWGLYVASNGNTRVFLDSDYGRVLATGDMRAPVYYDSDNTSYYVDSNNTSNLNLVHAQSVVVTGSTTDRNVVRAIPKGASASYNNTVTGAFKIRLPFRANDMMWMMTVKIYDYSGNSISEYQIGNYSYSAGAYQIAASFFGSNNAASRTVRLGNDGSYDCVWIGETSGTWNHPVIAVTDFMGGYANASASVTDDNWDISLATSFGTIGGTINPTNRFYSVTAESAISAPIFYDSNNTAYYTDPASATSGSFAGFVGIGNSYGSDDGGWGSRLNVGGGPHARLDVRCANDGIITTMFSHTGNGVGKIGMMSNHPLVLMAQAGSTGGYVYSGSVRSSIFYDSDDTTYYVDPNSTGVALRIAGAIRGDHVNWTGEHNKIQWHSAHMYFQNMADGYWIFRKSTGAEPFLLHADGWAQASGSWRAPQFYDSNDTAYYGDFASTSNINALTMAGTLRMYGGSYYGTIRFGTSDYWACGISQRDAANAEMRIWARGGGSGSIYFATGYDGESGSATLPTDGMALKNNNLGLGSFTAGEFPSHKLYVKGTGYATSDFRAPIFYDANDTGYYVDPASTSVLNRISTVRTNDWLYLDNNYGHSVVGVYSASRYQGVFAMGDAYKLPADGTSTGGLYGMAWSHPNAGGAAGNLTDHGLLIINNGGFRCAISNSIVASANITAYSDERLKTNWRDMPEDYVTRLAKVKVGIYDRVDQEDVTQVGVSAQSFQELLPQAIMTAKDEMQTLSVSYGNAALASAVELAKEVVDLRNRVAQLESLITKLIGD